MAHRLGISETLPDNASLALGTGEVGLLEMAGAYATFFNGGNRVSPTGIESIVADERNELRRAPRRGRCSTPTSRR